MGGSPAPEKPLGCINWITSYPAEVCGVTSHMTRVDSAQLGLRRFETLETRNIIQIWHEKFSSQSDYFPFLQFLKMTVNPGNVKKNWD